MVWDPSATALCGLGLHTYPYKDVIPLLYSSSVIVSHYSYHSPQFFKDCRDRSLFVKIDNNIIVATNSSAGSELQLSAMHTL